MPIIKSAIKRVRQTATRTQRNAAVKKSYKALIKEFLALVEQKKTEDAAKLFPQVQKALDLAAKKNLVPANTAARKKSSLARHIAKSGVAGVKANKAAAPKKAAPAKKPAAQKAPAKK